MLDFIFDAGFDGLLPGRAGERSRTRRAAKTLDEFGSAGTVTFPGALRTATAMTTGYVTLRPGSIIFTRVSGAKMTHTDVEWADLQAFSTMENTHKAERDVSKWWTLIRLTYPSTVTVLACAPNGRSALLNVLDAQGVPQLAL